MAKKRSKRRRKTGRSSLPPSKRPSATPSVQPPTESEPASSKTSGDEESSTDRTKPDKTAPEPVESKDKASTTDAPRDEAPKAVSAPEQESSGEPPREAKTEPHEVEEGDPGLEPGDDGASDAKPDAAPDQSAKAEDHREEDPEEDERESDAGDDAAQDDGLHDDFFRKGEEVDKEHIAARAEAANGAPRLEDTGQTRLVALRTTPEMVARRKKLRKIVGYVLAPAVVIALVAGFKLYNGEDNGKARAGSPVTSVIVQPSSDPSAATVSTPGSAGGMEPGGSTLDGSEPDAEEAPEEADAASDVVADAETDGEAEPDAVPEAGAQEETPEDVDVPEGVDPAKAALAALNRAQWEKAAEMARAAIASNPENATLYLYQGTALQEMGRGDEAKAVFKRCVDNAKRGPINECRMFAR